MQQQDPLKQQQEQGLCFTFELWSQDPSPATSEAFCLGCGFRHRFKRWRSGTVRVDENGCVEVLGGGRTVLSSGVDYDPKQQALLSRIAEYRSDIQELQLQCSAGRQVFAKVVGERKTCTDDDVSDSGGQQDAQQPIRCSTRVPKPKQFADHVGFLNSDSSSSSSSSGSDDDEDGSQHGSDLVGCADHVPQAADVAVSSAGRAYRHRQGELQARGGAWASRVTRSAVATRTAKASSAQQKATKKPEQPQQKRAKAGTGPQKQQPTLQQQGQQQPSVQRATRRNKRTAEPLVQQPTQPAKRMSTRASKRAGG